MSSSEYHPVRIGELLPSLLKRLGKPPVPVLQAVFGKWHEIVGETLGDEIAQNCTSSLLNKFGQTSRSLSLMASVEALSSR